MSEKTFLVTGATDGIGWQTALVLAQQGHHVFVHGRSEQTALHATVALRRETGSDKIQPCAADFSSLAQVRTLGQSLATRLPALDGLINNAGIYAQRRQLSEDGHELTLAVNHLAPFLLTHLLLPALKAAPQGRVVNVSSIAHLRANLDLDNLQLERNFSSYLAYANSKLANLLFTFSLVSRLEGTRVTSNGLHPGVITTKLLKQGFGSTGASLAQGAATSLLLATDPGLAHTTGAYFADGRPTQPSPSSRDVALQERFYQRSAELVGL